VSQRRSSPTGSLQPGRRCVETSGDVIGLLLETAREAVKIYLQRPRAVGFSDSRPRDFVLAPVIPRLVIVFLVLGGTKAGCRCLSGAVPGPIPDQK
jgi:hypothetical protein